MTKTIAIPVLSIRHHGGTKILVELANVLSRWAKVDFIVPKGCVDTPYTIDATVTIREISVGQFPRALTRTLFLIKCIPVLMKYDLVVANFFVTYFSALIASCLSRVKLAYLVQDIESKYQKPYGTILNLLCEITYYSNSIITANPFLEQEIVKRGTRPLFNFTVGVSDIFFSHLIGRDKKFDIICFARRESWKNLDMFMAFLAEYKRPLSVAVVSQDRSLLEQIKNTDFALHHVHCFQPVDTEALLEVLDASEIMVSTSMREGFSLPPLEAMARGVCVTLYPSGGPSLYVRDGVNALYFKTSEEMMDRVTTLLSDSDLRERLRKNAVKTAQQYRLSRELERLSGFIKSHYV